MKKFRLHRSKIIAPLIGNMAVIGMLMGCAAANSNQLLDMINRGEQIEIEVAVPINQEDGTETTVAWTQLDQLTSQPELRKAMDDIFKIIPQGDSKNGVLYVNLEGNQDGNNTLYNVFTNSIFRNNYWNNESIQEKVAEAVAKNYTDVEFEDGHYNRVMLAAINAYFNILNDSEPGFANLDSTISRLEAMAAIFKAEYPVTDTLTEDNDFNVAVGVDSSNEYAIFASNLSEQSFLSISSGSLDKLTAKGTITRGELVYMLVQKYFADEYNAVDTKATCFSDAKNGGDIATAQKFIENGTEKEGWQAYELTYALQNPDKGCPERMYKALVVAYNKGIITDTDCRWDEAVTKADLLEMLTNTYLTLPVAISAERGTVDEYEVQVDEPTTDENEKVDLSEINDTDTQVADGEENETESTSNNSGESTRNGNEESTSNSESNNNSNSESNSNSDAPAEETPADISSESSETQSFALNETDIELLKYFGATDSEIANIHSSQELDSLLTRLLEDFDNNITSSSGSGSTGGSGNTGGSSGDGEDDYDPSRQGYLNPDDGSLPGSM